MPDELTETLTEDRLLGGRVRLSQPARGYRAAIDPVLLAAAVPASAGETVLDAGAGSGAASLCLAARVPSCRIVGLEIQRNLQRLASRNVQQNACGQRIEMIEGDLRRLPPRLAGTIFDHVITNPPYLTAAAVTISAIPECARARVEHGLDLADWLASCLRMLKPGGTFTLIHRADRLADALAALRAPLGELVVFPLWPRAGDRPAKRVLVQGRKARRGPLRLSPGLVLHDDDGVFSPAAEAVLRHAKPLVLLDRVNGGGDG